MVQVSSNIYAGKQEKDGAHKTLTSIHCITKTHSDLVKLTLFLNILFYWVYGRLTVGLYAKTRVSVGTYVLPDSTGVMDKQLDRQVDRQMIDM